MKEKVLAVDNIHPHELDHFTVADDAAEVVRIIKKAHAESGFDAPPGPSVSTDGS